MQRALHDTVSIPQGMSYLRLMTFLFYRISRPWDLSHRIGADFLSNLPYKLVKMVGYGSENDAVSSDFEIFTFIICFSTF